MMETEMNKIEQRMAHNVPNLIGAGPLVIGLLASMFVLNIWLAFAILSTMAAAILIQSLVFSSKKNMQTAVEGSKRIGEMTRWFNEYLRGISTIKIFGGGQSFQKLENSILSYRDYLLDFTRRTAIPFSLFKVLMLAVCELVWTRDDAGYCFTVASVYSIANRPRNARFFGHTGDAPALVIDNLSNHFHLF